MEKIKGKNNRTITLSSEEQKELLSLCIKPEKKIEPFDVSDKVILGNFFQVAKHLPDAFADLVIVDPPYNMNKTFNKSTFRKMKDDDYASFTEKWVVETKRLMRDNASIYVCCDWESSNTIGEVLSRHFVIRNRITWQREKGRGAQKNWKNGMEDIWFATLSDNYYFDLESVKVRRKVLAPYKQDGVPKDWKETDHGKFRDTCPSNFWDDISIPYWSMPENTEHPTQKPEKLLAKLIIASSKENDLVFDPFLGSGTTAITSKKLSRHFCGVEIDESYCALAQKRLIKACTDKRIQGYSDGVFWERNTLQAKSNNK